MNIKCSRCNDENNHKILGKYDNDSPPHIWVECLNCGNNFNHWLCGIDKLKEIFESSWKLYE
ncbi:MAG: hypothetical protein AABY22_29080 [Nanoarchaeota archaeon]